MVVFLKLFFWLKKLEVVFIGFVDLYVVLKFFFMVKVQVGLVLIGFEIMFCVGVDFCFSYLDGVCDFLEGEYVWYILMELLSGLEVFLVCDLMEGILGEVFEVELVEDVVFVQNFGQVQDFWYICYGMFEVQKVEGGLIKYDVFVFVVLILDFLDWVIVVVEDFVFGCCLVLFGYFGDGNIYFNVS